MKRFINCMIPVSACNLKCEYCYVSHTEGRRKNQMPHWKYDAKHIRKALSIERLGGPALMNFCGEGETLLPHEVVEILKEILSEGHYVELVTNATLTDRINEILKFDEKLLAHLEFKCSFHYKELIRLGLLNTYIENVKNIKNSSASLTVELVPYDELIEDIPEIKKICLDNFGAICHVTVARDEKTKEMRKLTSMTDSELENIWGDSFDSEMFRFKSTTFNIKRKEFCYAGEWALFLDLASGYAKQCYKSFYTQNIYEDIEKPITFKPIGSYCLSPHCFNSHALMTLGLIPSIKTPSYDAIRNRVCQDGEEWLKPEMKAFLGEKLSDSNEILTKRQEKKANVSTLVGAPVGITKQIINKVKKKGKKDE